MTIMLTRAGLREASQFPPELTTHEVNGLLTGNLHAPTKQALRAQLATQLTAPEYAQLFTPDVLDRELPDARAWTGRIALALIEVLAGRRPAAQMSKHVNQEVLGRLTRRHRLAVRRGGTSLRTKVLRVRVCQVSDVVIEAAIVCHINGRPSPIAMRAEGVDGRWQVTVLELI